MPDQQPNFILFMTDQQRGDCLSSDGHPCLLTPRCCSVAAALAYFVRGQVGDETMDSEAGRAHDEEGCEPGNRESRGGPGEALQEKREAEAVATEDTENTEGKSTLAPDGAADR